MALSQVYSSYYFQEYGGNYRRRRYRNLPSESETGFDVRRFLRSGDKLNKSTDLQPKVAGGQETGRLQATGYNSPIGTESTGRSSNYRRQVHVVRLLVGYYPVNILILLNRARHFNNENNSFFAPLILLLHLSTIFRF